MEFWKTVRINPRITDYHWLLVIFTLYSPCQTSIRLRKSYRSRCEWWLTFTYNACEWCLILFLLYLRTRRAWIILWEVYLQGDMTDRCPTSLNFNSVRLSWVRTSLGANKILRSDSNHQPFQRYPLYRGCACDVALRGFCSGQCDTQPFLFTAFYPPFASRCNSHFTHPITSQDRK